MSLEEREELVIDRGIARERLLLRVRELLSAGGVEPSSRRPGWDTRLWSIVIGRADSRIGSRVVTRGERLELRDLAAEAGGWWSFSDRLVFLPIEEWVDLYQRVVAAETWATRGAKR